VPLNLQPETDSVTIVAQLQSECENSSIPDENNSRTVKSSNTYSNFVNLCISICLLNTFFVNEFIVEDVSSSSNEIAFEMFISLKETVKELELLGRISVPFFTILSPIQ